MLQVRKSHSCGISAISCQCCFMIETQVFMAGSDFSGFFSRNHFLEGGFTFSLFNWGGGCFLLGGFVNYFIILLFVYYLFGGFDRGNPGQVEGFTLRIRMIPVQMPTGALGPNFAMGLLVTFKSKNESKCSD